MPLEKIRPTRYAHLEGHTDVCYSDDGRHVITCGLDGDIRLFENLDDDDCVTHSLADEVHCVAYQNDCVIAGTSFNIVQSYTPDEGKPNGIITRCTAFPTHITVSRDKKLIAVGSSDMTAKVHDTENFQDLVFSGHSAPVLSVALDPKRDFLATSSCDGTVRVWNYRTQTMVRSFPLIPKSNDFAFSSTLCRLCWSLDGQHLIVPVDSELRVFNRDKWKVEFTLEHPSITGTASVSIISPCGQYVAVGCRDGRIAVWDLRTRACIASEKSPMGKAVTGLAWHPKRTDQLAFVNSGGEFGMMQDILQESTPKPSSEIEQEPEDDKKVDSNVDIFPSDDLEDDDDAEISIAKIKSQLGFADDAEGTFIGVPKSQQDGDLSRPGSRIETPLPTPAPIAAPKLPEPQKPFQPGMTPEHLSDRYMLWNNTGIVRQYESEEEHSIEVEFHDSSIHHPLHLNNHMGHTMAALSNEALALAVESQSDQLSKLMVHYFSVWDGSREWQLEMDDGEDVLAVALGTGWVAAATDLRFLRVFSLGGTQREIISIPGPIVCLAGFEKSILIVFHSGIGVCGEQSMSALVLNISGKKHLAPAPFPVSLSPKSFLAWAGFTDEGTPMIMDSVGVVRLLNMSMGTSWSPILSTKLHAKGKSDHYFLLGASEVQNMVRCILCKGARYPSVLPRPHVSLLNFKIPLCESTHEKSLLEETVNRSKLLSSTIDRLAKDGFDMEGPQKENNKTLKESMVKLFALACRTEREARAVDICEWMPSADMVEVAVKYAAKLHRMQLAERLNEVVQRKVEESLRVEEDDDKEMYVYRSTGRGRHVDVDYVNEVEAEVVNPSSPVEKDAESMDEMMKRNPLLAASHKQNSKDSSTRLSLTPGSRNPFKRVSSSAGNARGMQVLDTLKVSRQEDSGPSVLKPVMKKPKARQTSLKPPVQSNASILLETHEKENKTTNIADAPSEKPANNTVNKKPSALKLWMDDNIEMIKEKFPNASDKELFGKSALLFKDVEDSVKQKYKARAAESSQPVIKHTDKSENTSELETVDEKKRKGELETTEEPKEKKMKQTTVSKLAGFAFGKKSE